MEEKKFCYKCGNEIFQEAEICPKCGCRQYSPNTQSSVNTKGITTLLLCILLGAFGAHRFYVGRTGSAIAILLITLLLGWIVVGIIISGIWVLIDLINIVCGNFTDSNGEKIKF